MGSWHTTAHKDIESWPPGCSWLVHRCQDRIVSVGKNVQSKAEQMHMANPNTASNCIVLAITMQLCILNLAAIFLQFCDYTCHNYTGIALFVSRRRMASESMEKIPDPTLANGLKKSDGKTSPID